MSELKFDKSFIFGAASAAYQIEGGYDEDGKGLSIWDVFCRTPENIRFGENGNNACNSYHLWKEDVKLLKEMGADAYRFSVSWPRVMPDGTGRINEAGTDYYKRLCDELIENGIEPYVTLYHWDLPYELSLKGGLMNRDFAGWFAEYTSAVSKALGDRVRHYFTFNEPQTLTGYGYAEGNFAPGFRLGDNGCFPVLHNLLLAHGDATRILHGAGKTSSIVNCGDSRYPADGNDKELSEKTRRLTFGQESLWSLVNVFDPVYFGDYNKEFYQKYAREAEYFIKTGDMKRIASGSDFCCINTYTSIPYERDGEGGVRRAERKRGAPLTLMGWDYDEKGMQYFLRFLWERYRKPLMVTENGMSCHDIPSADGRVHDADRIEYFRRFLSQIMLAKESGVDVRGYFVWSLLDNFEWASGYSQRFGLAYVDYETYKRIPKDSLYYLKEVFSKR